MEIITKELEALAYDLKVLKASLSECKRDCDRDWETKVWFALAL